MAKINYINAEQLREINESEGLVIIDIREHDEYRREHIPGAVNLPVNNFDYATANKLCSSAKTVVIHCLSGNRTRINESKFKQLPIDEVMILDGGINAWKRLGCVIVKNNKAPLPLMRQVQMIAGLLILAGVILGYIVSPGFLLISGFVGLGLFIAGATGYCGMANLLMLLPYNKANGCNNGCAPKRN